MAQTYPKALFVQLLQRRADRLRDLPDDEGKTVRKLGREILSAASAKVAAP